MFIVAGQINFYYCLFSAFIASLRFNWTSVAPTGSRVAEGKTLTRCGGRGFFPHGRSISRLDS